MSDDPTFRGRTDLKSTRDDPPITRGQLRKKSNPENVDNSPDSSDFEDTAEVTLANSSREFLGSSIDDVSVAQRTENPHESVIQTPEELLQKLRETSPPLDKQSQIIKDNANNFADLTNN